MVKVKLLAWQNWATAAEKEAEIVCFQFPLTTVDEEAEEEGVGVVGALLNVQVEVWLTYLCSQSSAERPVNSCVNE